MVYLATQCTYMNLRYSRLHYWGWYDATYLHQITMAAFTKEHTVRIKDLDKLNLVKLAYGGKVLSSSSRCPKNDACFASG